MAGYALAVVGGPTVGPIVSAAVVQVPYLGWRWTEYLTGILQTVVLINAVIFIDETYPPVLLVFKARRLRHDSGNFALHAKFEEWEPSIPGLCRKFLIRPVQLLCTPICFLMALYASFCYGILYMQLGAIPIIFGELRGWNLLQSELPFLAICLGTFTGAALNTLNQLAYTKAYHAAGDRAVPEKRLPPMMLGSVLFAVGQFITAWTADPRSAPWIAPVIGLYLMGCGFNTIFQAALNYLVDTFRVYAGEPPHHGHDGHSRVPGRYANFLTQPVRSLRTRSYAACLPLVSPWRFLRCTTTSAWVRVPVSLLGSPA